MDVVTIKCSGGKAKVFLDVPQGKQIENWRKGRFYEARFLEYVKKNYRGGTWIDGGSALGNHTLFFAMFCECDRVISIDPILDSLKLQEQILQLNGVNRKVHTVHSALSDYAGFGTMERFGPGVGHWQLGNSTDDNTQTPVNMLDGLDLHGVQVLKLDIEGAEFYALRGAQTLLDEQRPAVFCEANTRQEVSALDDYLSGFGYKHGKHFHTMHEWSV